MTTLHLGVLDLPHLRGNKSTGDIAELLEKKYHVMEMFYREHEALISAALMDGVVDALEDSMSGGPGLMNMTAATSSIELLFKQFISRRGLDGLVPGVPTQASLKGVSHRRRHPYAKGNPVRASFVDTGLYVNSMKAWVEGEPLPSAGVGGGAASGEGAAGGEAEGAAGGGIEAAIAEALEGL